MLQLQTAFQEAVLNISSTTGDHTAAREAINDTIEESNWQSSIRRQMLSGVEFLNLGTMKAEPTTKNNKQLYLVIFHRHLNHPSLRQKLSKPALTLGKNIFGDIGEPDESRLEYYLDGTHCAFFVVWCPEDTPEGEKSNNSPQGQKNVVDVQEGRMRMAEGTPMNQSSLLVYQHRLGDIELVGLNSFSIIEAAPPALVKELPPTNIPFKVLIYFGRSGGFVQSYRKIGMSLIGWRALAAHFQLLYFAGYTQSVAVMKTFHRAFPHAKVWPLECTTPEEWQEAKALLRIAYDSPENAKFYGNIRKEEIYSTTFLDSWRGKGTHRDAMVERFSKSLAHFQGVSKTKHLLSRDSMPDFDGNPWVYRHRYPAGLTQMFSASSTTSVTHASVSTEQKALDAFIDRSEGDGLLFFVKLCQQEPSLFPSEVRPSKKATELISKL